VKVINLIWRDPSGNTVKETIPADKFKIHTDSVWLKLNKVEDGGGIVRILPVQKVELVEFGEVEEKSNLIVPPGTGPVPVPRDFQTS
jgi:hypothetical protein